MKITNTSKQKDFVKLSEEWFDNQAKVYDETDTILYSKYGKISCKNICDYLADKTYQTLLDVGCGTAYLIELLSKTHDAKHVGLDLASEMIRQAGKKNIDGAEFVVGRSDGLPFEDNSFDVVTCSQSFHHYPDTDKAMQEAFRVLKPGGIYILSDTGVGFFRMFGVMIDNFVYTRFGNTGDCNVSYLNKSIRDLKRNGFEIVKGEKLTTFIYTVVARKR
ncbi:MAG: methyltransferase domain-containing protein [Lachnospiraceae bacterium]|nr:methyltransferase domain-containing protein [Lachnospiraceae bacterium]